MKFYEAVYILKVKWGSENIFRVNGKEYAHVQTGIKLEKTGKHEIIRILKSSK